jgi:glycosyltransferase involved in cell wall biosynthesis
MDSTVIIKTVGRPSLKAAIRSAKKEGFKVIVVSDGVKVSAQGATRLVKLGKQWGYYGGMAANVGAAMAETEWITFLDDDDVFIPGAGEIIREKIKNPDVDVWVGGARFNKKIQIHNHSTNPPILEFEGHDLAMDRERGVRVGNVSCPTVRTSVFAKSPVVDTVPENMQHLTDCYLLNQWKTAGFRVDWMESVIYLVRPHKKGLDSLESVNGGGTVS